MKIEKKCWPELFEKVLAGEKNCDLRINDFEIAKGDELVLAEFEPKTKKYTGRKISKKVSGVTKIENLMQMYSEKELKQKGVIIIELEEG